MTIENLKKDIEQLREVDVQMEEKKKEVDIQIEENHTGGRTRTPLEPIR